MALYHLGLATSGHDPALAIVDASGRICFAEATERFVQDKRAWGISPDHVNHLAAALKAVGFDPASDKLQVATSWKKVKADLPVQIVDTFLPASDGLWLRELQAAMQQMAGASLLRLGLASQMPAPRRYDHHLCHAVTACAFAPIEDAACLIIDGEGEVGALTQFVLRARRLKRVRRSWGPGSLGTFYAWLTHMCGFDWRLGEEWKVMGLAAYGSPDPAIVEQMVGLVQMVEGKLLFPPAETLAQLLVRLAPLARGSKANIMESANLAASGQTAYAQFADQLLAECLEGSEGNLILSGGCALNSSYNGTIIGRTGFDRLFVPPAPADDGNAIGAALLSWMETQSDDRIPLSDGAPWLGSAASEAGLKRLNHLSTSGLKCRDVAGHSEVETARLLADGKIIGVMRGRAEFGPRALGNRSILADPRLPGMKDRINREVKGREPYRPFAPVVAEETVMHWFERPQPSPYMSITLPWRDKVKAKVPAVVHADGTGRLQTVASQTAPWMHGLLQHLGARTGVPVLLNTSFNIMGKPIVHSVEDALAVFLTSGLDALLIEELLIEK